MGKPAKSVGKTREVCDRICTGAGGNGLLLREENGDAAAGDIFPKIFPKVYLLF